MIKIHKGPIISNVLVAAVLCLAAASDAEVINIDFNGARNVPGPRGPGPTFSGVGAAGGGPVWNGILANSQLGDGTDDDNLTVSGTNLLDSVGGATTISFSIGPVGGDDASGGGNASASAALFGDEIFVGAFGQGSGTADFTISGLEAGRIRLYLYSGNAGNFVIPGASPTPISASGIFTPLNTVFYSRVDVTNGIVTGTMGTGQQTRLFGMTIQNVLPQPSVRSASPTGADVTNSATITVELEDYVTEVVTNSVVLLVNGSEVTATVSKPPGSLITTVTYTPPSNWADGSTNTFSISFGDNAVPPLVQTNDFTFTVFNKALAAATVNIDFNGVRLCELLGPTYVGAGPAGGGTSFNGILIDSRGPGCTQLNNRSASRTNLLNSLGAGTTVSFAIDLVTGDNPSAQGANPLNVISLIGDYVVQGPALGDYMGPGTFTISGLGAALSVDIYISSHLNGSQIKIGGASPAISYVPMPGAATTFAQNVLALGGGTLNWVYVYTNVPVTSGSITGLVDASSVLTWDGVTIQSRTTPLTLLPLVLNSSYQSGTLTLSWNGIATLQAAGQVSGPWNDIATTSPWPVPLSGNDGLYVLEAEHFNSQSTGTGVALGEDWVFTSTPTNAGGDGSIGWSGNGTIQALPNGSENLNLGSNTTDGPRANYNVNIGDPGTYYIWVRGFGDSAPGASTDDSLHMGIDGAFSGTAISAFPQGAGYVWSSGGAQSFLNVTAGPHVITVAMRETGMIVDKVILTKDPSYIPTGMGPAEGPPESRPVIPEPMQFYRLKQ